MLFKSMGSLRDSAPTFNLKAAAFFTALALNAYALPSLMRPEYIGAATTITIPEGVTSIRGYACGKGGDGGVAVNSVGGGSGGGGGGMQFGDIAVQPGDVITISGTTNITLAINGVIKLTGYPGQNGATNAPGGLGGIAGVLAAGVTNGGAYPGGNGGSSTGTAAAPQHGGGGASSGSPLGPGKNGENASAAQSGAGSGIGGVGVNGFGGGAGSDATASMSGGAGPNNRGRSILNLYTDPLLRWLTSPGVLIDMHGGPGAGGGRNGGHGGTGAGGGIQSGTNNSGSGGLMGGGAGAPRIYSAGSSLGGGGGGGSNGAPGGVAWAAIYFNRG